MAQEFLTKNADSALVEIKEILYERLTTIRSRIEWLSLDDDVDMRDEVKFLQNLLDIIERS